MIEINDKAIKALGVGLNFRQLRNEIHTANIANSETPGYKAKRLDFEKSLARALNIDGQLPMKISNSEHFNVGQGGVETLEPTLYDDPNGVVREDGNTVDRESELADMAQNRLLYDASVQLLNKKLGLYNYLNSSER